MLACEWIEGCAPPPRSPQQLSSCAGYVAPEMVLTRRRPVNGLTVIQLYAWHRRRDFRFESIIPVGPSRIAPIAAPQIQRVAIETSGRSRAIQPGSYVFVDPAQTIGGRENARR